MNTSVDGWQQVRAGLALIELSHLASWRGSDARLVAASADRFEQTAATTHIEFGRVMSWVLFSVGCEYVLKGACLVRELMGTGSKFVLRSPASEDDLVGWVAAALDSHASVQEEVVTTGTLVKLPIAKLVAGSPEKDLAMAAFKLLRDMRNRDAHHYAQNVRALQFQAVPKLLVPLLNVALRSLDQARLCATYPGPAA